MTFFTEIPASLLQKPDFNPDMSDNKRWCFDSLRLFLRYYHQEFFSLLMSEAHPRSFPLMKIPGHRFACLHCLPIFNREQSNAIFKHAFSSVLGDFDFYYTIRGVCLNFKI